MMDHIKEMMLLTEKETHQVCKWCGEFITGRVYKDGPNTYCSSECIAAGQFPVMVFIATILFSIILAITFIPSVYSFVFDYFGHIIIMFGFYVIVLLVAIFALHTAIKGWSKRHEDSQFAHM